MLLLRDAAGPAGSLLAGRGAGKGAKQKSHCGGDFSAGICNGGLFTQVELLCGAKRLFEATGRAQHDGAQGAQHGAAASEQPRVWVLGDWKAVGDADQT